MPGGVARGLLLRQMAAYFPDKWEVSHLRSRSEGENVVGAVKIHCREDDKTFLSDFSIRLDRRGKIAELTLDGVAVGKFVKQLHHREDRPN